MWLPSPWDVRPVQGGLGGNKEFEQAVIEAQSESSKGVKLLVEGKLGRNNALKLTEKISSPKTPLNGGRCYEK